MHCTRSRTHLVALALIVSVAVGCSSADDQPDTAADAAAATAGIGHLFLDTTSGIALDLPSNWRGRYRLERTASERVRGLQHELTMRFVRLDSSVATDSVMLVARVFDKDAWREIAADTTSIRFGQAVSEDEKHTLVLRRATGNPFTRGTVDALAFDSMMVAFYRRPLRASLRANVVTARSDPAEPGSSSP